MSDTKNEVPAVEVSTARNCAWRALYVYVRGRCVAHVGIDPTAPGGPRFFAGVAKRDVSVRLPHITWAMARDHEALLLPIYGLQQQALNRLDGRFQARAAR